MDDSGGQVRAIEKENLRSEENGKQDEEEWIPNEAYSLGHKFREFHGNDLTPLLVNQLLADLNKIWREREKKQITRVKQECQEKIH